MGLLPAPSTVKAPPGQRVVIDPPASAGGDAMTYDAKTGRMAWRGGAGLFSEGVRATGTGFSVLNAGNTTAQLRPSGYTFKAAGDQSLPQMAARDCGDRGWMPERAGWFHAYAVIAASWYASSVGNIPPDVYAALYDYPTQPVQRKRLDVIDSPSSIFNGMQGYSVGAKVDLGIFWSIGYGDGGDTAGYTALQLHWADTGGQFDSPTGNFGSGEPVVALDVYRIGWL